MSCWTYLFDQCIEEVKRTIHIGKTNFYNMKNSDNSINTKTRNKEATGQVLYVVNPTVCVTETRIR